MVSLFHRNNPGRDVYELVESSGNSRLSQVTAAYDGGPRETSKLPPKRLPGHRLLRSLCIVTLPALLLWIALLVLVIKLKNFKPDTTPDDTPINVKGSAQDVSCDLLGQQGLQGAFNINLRLSTHFSFGAAKAVDVVFDLFVGQGLRFILGLISYNVFMDGLTRMMEVGSVSYTAFASLAFSPISLSSVWEAVKEIYKAKGWRPKLFLFWFAIATFYVLGTTTLLSAASGYVNPSSTRYQMPDGSFAASNSDNLTSCFDVGDAGNLIGLEKHTMVDGPPAHRLDPLTGTLDQSFYESDDSETIQSILVHFPLYKAIFNYYEAINGDSLFSNFSECQSNLTDERDDERLGPDRKNKRTRDFIYPYNTTACYINITVYDHIYAFNETVNGSLAFNPSPSYCYLNQTLSMSLPTQCIPESFFAWGFSSLLLYITISLQLAWMAGMYIVWLEANVNSQLVRRGRRIRGPLRAASDLVEAMREVLGDEYCAYSNSELEKELAKDKGRVRYFATDATKDGVAHVGLSSRRGERVNLNLNQLYGSSTGFHIQDS